MLNRSGISKTTLTATRQILANVELQSSVGCIVPKALGVAVGSKTIAKAGTPIKIDLMNLQTAAVKADGTTALNAVLLHDVDFWFCECESCGFRCCYCNHYCSWCDWSF